MRKRVDVAADIDAFTVDFDGLVPGTLRHGDNAGHDAGGHACGQPHDAAIVEDLDQIPFLDLALSGINRIDPDAVGMNASELR